MIPSLRVVGSIKRWRTAPQALLVVLVATLTLRGALSAQPIGSTERARGRQMLGNVRDHIEKYYYDSAFRGIDLRAAAARADSQIRLATSHSQIFTIIARFVQSLDDSHTTFIPPDRVTEVHYGWELQMIGDSCFVVWVAPKSDAAAKGLRIGDRVLAVDKHQPSRRHFWLLSYNLYALSPRSVVRLEVEASDGSPRAMSVQASVTKRPFKDLAALVREAENAETQATGESVKVGDSLLILRLGKFGDASEIDRVMRDVHNTNTLILDLRGNPGGPELGLSRLVGHVFDQRLVIGTIRSRRDTSVIESKPVRDPFTGRLYVLIDSRSASSAEMFAYLIQLKGRGVVLGDRSAGAVMRSRTYRLITGMSTIIFYQLSIADADVIMPDGTRLEGRGVQPDALVLPSGADLAAGRDPVLAIALTMAGRPMDATRASALLRRQGAQPR